MSLLTHCLFAPASSQHVRRLREFQKPGHVVKGISLHAAFLAEEATYRKARPYSPLSLPKLGRSVGLIAPYIVLPGRDLPTVTRRRLMLE